MKKLISLGLVVIMVACMIPTAALSASAKTTVSTGNFFVDEFINFAISLQGNKKSYFGFTEPWSNKFIGWLGEELDYDFIQPMSESNDGPSIGNWIATNGGTFNYFYADTQTDAKYGTKMDEADYEPSPGDIVFFRSSTRSSMESPNCWSNSAIVYKVTEDNIYVVHGDWSGKVAVGTEFSRKSEQKYGTYYYRVAGYATPAYPQKVINEAPKYGDEPGSDNANLKLNVSSVTLPIGLTCQIEATDVSVDATTEGITYKSQDTTVARVNKSGLVTPVKVGETKIIVTSGTRTRAISVMVTDKITSLIESIPSTANNGDYKEIDLYRYVYNEEVRSDTEILGKTPDKIETTEPLEWSEVKETTEQPTESETLKIISTETTYNVEKWTATTDIPVYSDKALTQQVGTIASSQQFNTYERTVSSGKLIAHTTDGYVAVRTTSKASAYARFDGTEFVVNEKWKTSVELNVRASASTSGTWVASYQSGTIITITAYAETDKYLWGKTDKGWVALYNYSDNGYNAIQQTEGAVTVYRYSELAGKTTYVYFNQTGVSNWQIAPLTATGSTTVEKKTLYYGATTASAKYENGVWANGVDISRWNGKVDYAKMKADGVDFVILRIGYGAEMDVNFEANYAAAKAAGMDVGVYLYTIATTTDEAVAEANALIEWSKGKKYEYPVFYDIENKTLHAGMTNRQRTDLCLAFTETIYKAGLYPGIYSSYYWLLDSINMDEINQQFGTWVAAWTSSGSPNKDYSEYNMWQYTDSGKVNGVSGYVDKNVCYVDYPSMIIGGGYNGYSVINFAEPEIDIFDVNCDGTTDALDLLEMQQIMLGITDASSAADVNLDGVVDSKDLVIMQMALLNMA